MLMSGAAGNTKQQRSIQTAKHAEGKSKHSNVEQSFLPKK